MGSDNRRVPAEATLPHRATPVVGPHRYAEVEVGERSGNAKRSDPIGQAGAPSWPAPFRAERVPGRPSGLRPEATTEAVFIPTRACRNGLRSAGSLPARRRVGPRRRGHAPGRGSSRTREDLGSSRGVFDPLPGRPKVVPEGIRPPPVKTQGHPGGYSTPSREDPRSSRRGFDPPPSTDGRSSRPDSTWSHLSPAFSTSTWRPSRCRSTWILLSPAFFVSTWRPRRRGSTWSP